MSDSRLSVLTKFSQQASGGLRAYFSSPLNSALTVTVFVLIIKIAGPFVEWAFINATWSGTAQNCDGPTPGACWPFLWHKLQFILFGLFPSDAYWRPAFATSTLLVLIALTGIPQLWTRYLPLIWLILSVSVLWLMRGGLGLPVISTAQWGGLPVTLMLAAAGLAVGYPVGVLLAIARQSRMSLLRIPVIAYIESIRSVPLIALLYFTSLVAPLMLPVGIRIDKIVYAQIGITSFAAAYFAEAIRSGIQMIPRNQIEAARALGLGWWKCMRLVVLPQACRHAIPASISIVIGFFQDTSLVVIIGLFDLLNTARIAAQDPNWFGYYDEAYLFAAGLFFAGSAVISRYGLWLEHYMKLGISPVSQQK